MIFWSHLYLYPPVLLTSLLLFHYQPPSSSSSFLSSFPSVFSASNPYQFLLFFLTSSISHFICLEKGEMRPLAYMCVFEFTRLHSRWDILPWRGCALFHVNLCVFTVSLLPSHSLPAFIQSISVSKCTQASPLGIFDRHLINFGFCSGQNETVIQIVPSVWVVV